MSSSDRLAVFRFDASPTMGAGHAARSLTLMAALDRGGWRTAAAVSPETMRSLPAAWVSGVETVVLEGPPTGETSEILTRLGVSPALAVVDHYGRGLDFEREFGLAAAVVAAFDDKPSRRHEVSLLIDQTPGRDAVEYAGLVPPACTVLAGAGFAAIRPEFADLRDAALAARRARGRPRPPRILVSLGATDPANLTETALDALALLDEPLRVDVVLSGAATHLDCVRTQLDQAPFDGRLLVDCENLSEVMAEADLAIGAGGVSCLERCVLGLPSILLMAAENQRDNLERLVRAGAGRAVELSAGPRGLADAVAALLDRGALTRMSTAAAALCDGLGVSRIAHAVERACADEGAVSCPAAC